MVRTAMTVNERTHLTFDQLLARRLHEFQTRTQRLAECHCATHGTARPLVDLLFRATLPRQQHDPLQNPSTVSTPFTATPRRSHSSQPLNRIAVLLLHRVGQTSVPANGHTTQAHLIANQCAVDVETHAIRHFKSLHRSIKYTHTGYSSR